MTADESAMEDRAAASVRRGKAGSRPHAWRKLGMTAQKSCPTQFSEAAMFYPRLSAFISGTLCFLTLAAGFGCAPAKHPGLPLAAYIPVGADAVAYADLDRLRSTPIYAKLPVPEQLRDASAVMAILKGRDWAVAGQGNFRQAPAGATMIGRDVAAAGAPALVDAMAKKPDGGADLVAHAPRDTPVWLVALGRATLPVTGNLANLNRLLHQAEYTAVGLRISNRVEIQAEAHCATEPRAQHLEENLRALGSLARVEAFNVTRHGTEVHVTAAVPTQALPELH